MDIKSRNYKRMGVVVVLLTLVTMTAAVMAFYPLLREQVYMNVEQVTGTTAFYDGYWMTINGKDYVFHDFWRIEQIVAWMCLGFSFLTAAIAFITGLIKPLGLTERKLFAMPFELLILTGGFALAFLSEEAYAIFDVVIGTVTGGYASELAQEFNFTYEQATDIVMAGNAALWALGLTFIYWFVISLASIFTMGLMRWLKERTIIGWILMGSKSAVKKTCVLVSSVDFRNNQTKLLLKIVGVNFVLMTVISCFWFFGIFGLVIYSIILFFLLRGIYDGMQQKYEVLLEATGRMAEGNLDIEINEDLGVFEPLKGEITKIRNGFKKAVNEEVKSQSMKTELITNVSHDLKTPLTAIITYVNLLKKEGITEEERQNYIGVLEQKSMRLKSLIEDLFEISKANSNNAILHLVKVDIVSLMKQVRLELEDKISRSQVEFRFNMPKEKVVLVLDSEKTYRVFENLLVNIVKYAMPGTRAYVEISDDGEKAAVSMKNISATEISFEGSDLTERFVRGDEARNTEGSGLGLAIAKSFVELQEGTMEVGIEADLFKVRIEWDRRNMPEAEDEGEIMKAEEEV